MIIYIVLAIILVVIVAYFKSSSVKGRISEQSIARKLDSNGIFGQCTKTLTNVYLPKSSGDTAEIDVLHITTKGILVLENKNYAGYIFGNEANKIWTVTLYAGKTWYGGNNVEKHQFYNPIWQNRTHIKHLKEYIGSDIKCFSLITFSNRGELKNVSYNSPEVYVCNHSKLSSVLRRICNNNPDILTDKQIEQIYEQLLPLTNANKEARQKHVTNIQKRFSNTDICPACGGKLVLRTARKGPNTGKQFYGCSNYPKCKYTR